MSDHRNHARRARRATTALAAAALLAAGLGAAGAGAAAPQQPAPHRDQVLAERASGEAAIRALGRELPTVAARNGITADELRRRLRADDDLWVDTTGALLFIDEGMVDHADEPVADAVEPAFGDHGAGDAFALHSRPGALRTIYLDFDGHDSPGGGWKGVPGPAYDLDGDPTSFSDTERQVIIDVWRHVAEDFAPFAIDVTTQDPGIDAIRRTTTNDDRYGTRVVITPVKTDCTSCGGVAYVGTFDSSGGSESTGWTHDHYQPAWVYSASSYPKYIAEAVSHEAGHNLGLSHDGVTGGTGYYQGHGDWAPIMGVGYYEPVSQWSKGEYAGANNTEDDFAVIASNGGTLAGDDHGGTSATATALAPGDVDVTGVLGTRIDVDAFRFTTAGGLVSLRASGSPSAPNADLSLRLVDDAGTTVQLVDPAGLAAELDLVVPAGTFTVLVDGVGAGDPRTTGYSDYASVGRYRLTGMVPDGGTTGDPQDPEEPQQPQSPPSAPSLAATPSSGTVTLSWDDVVGEAAYDVYRETEHRNGSFRGRTLVATLASGSTSFEDAPGGGTYRYQVVARNDAGASGSNLEVVTVSGGSSGPSKPKKGGGKGQLR